MLGSEAMFDTGTWRDIVKYLKKLGEEYSVE